MQVSRTAYVVVSQNRGNPNVDFQNTKNPFYREPQKAPLILGNPHVEECWGAVELTQKAADLLGFIRRVWDYRRELLVRI